MGGFIAASARLGLLPLCLFLFFTTGPARWLNQSANVGRADGARAPIQTAGGGDAAASFSSLSLSKTTASSSLYYYSGRQSSPPPPRVGGGAAAPGGGAGRLLLLLLHHHYPRLLKISSWLRRAPSSLGSTTTTAAASVLGPRDDHDDTTSPTSGSPQQHSKYGAAVFSAERHVLSAVPPPPSGGEAEHHRCLAGWRDRKGVCHEHLDEYSSDYLLRSSIARVAYSSYSPTPFYSPTATWPHFFSAAAASRPGYSWAYASDPWQMRAGVFGLKVYHKEAGGGGDCMYLSIAAAFAELGDSRLFPPMDAQDVRRAAAFGVIGSKELVAGTAVPKTVKDEFRTRLGIMAAQEQAGVWESRWSPSKILNESFYVNTAGRGIDTKRTKGKAEAVFSELTRPGHTHWGTATDLAGLEQELGVGFVVLQHSGTLYPLGHDADKRLKAYVLLYFIGGGHFQQAGIGDPESGIPIRSIFLPEEIPDFIHCVHMVDCHAPLFRTADFQPQQGLHR